ncbi:MAG: hypothetical protein AAGA03_05725, partial [Planctomycetota bacterium]
PISDYSAIADRCQPYRRVIVENHPKIGRDRLVQFHDRLARASTGTPPVLEVAVGLETIHPAWLKQLGKSMTLSDFDRYAEFLREQDVDLRVFLIVGFPGATLAEAMDWSMRSVHHACASGAKHISLIPARVGNGWDGLSDQLVLPTVEDMLALQRDLLMTPMVSSACPVFTIDVWGFDSSEGDSRVIDAIERQNRTQLPEPTS